jgi:hypothetical protein
VNTIYVKVPGEERVRCFPDVDWTYQLMQTGALGLYNRHTGEKQFFSPVGWLSVSVNEGR